MRRGAAPLLSLVLSTLAACSHDTVAPAAPAVSPTLAVNALTPASSGRHLVLMRGNDIPADFAERVHALGASVEFAHDGSGFAVINGLTSETAAALRAQNDVATVEADVIVGAGTTGLRSVDPAVTGAGTADPTAATQYARQWNLQTIRAERAWASGRVGSPAVRVAILDSGIDYLHPELAGLVG